jgi:hypothetical protein
LRELKRLYKEQVFDHYGRTCACCGEAIPEFLSIDHVNNDGNIQRKQRNGGNLYHWLVAHNFPEGFQTLCRNCNWGKHVNGGVCPHVKDTV